MKRPPDVITGDETELQSGSRSIAEFPQRLGVLKIREFWFGDHLK